MNYEAAMAYIQNTAKFGSSLGLERTLKILELMGNPQDKIKCIHVAGTNGKGSTTAMITGMLAEAGYRTGMYTSPFLEEFEERIQVDGKNIGKDDLARTVTEVSEAVEKVVSLGYDHPTEFEIITCAMFKHFCEAGVDYAVVEVGLGGRLDSTNVITPILSVITSISLDHTGVLGDTLKEIAAEKAGIIKKGVPVVSYPQEEEAGRVIKDTCIRLGCELVSVEPDSGEFFGTTGLAQKIRVKTAKEVYEPELSLLGKHQIMNCAVAVTAAEKLQELGLNISRDNIIGALKKVKWIGRLEVLKENPLVVIDGAHNIAGITLLSESLDTYFRYEKLILIIGILRDKQVEEMIKMIAPKACRVIAVTPNSGRAESSEELNEVILKYNSNSEACDDYSDAYEKALGYAGGTDLILVCGSLYMIGDMRKVIRSKK
ncbi:MAG TPA: folylpolyglutamate synthase/dihydrofolate synthase family protein [Clostridiaceae bacterium]|nr:folylpolyglutamate synthase/dihydrofolate synthase family protein [Clostridiaceae bacterium]